MVCDFEDEETTLAGDEGLGWEAGNLDGKMVDLSFRELKNFEIVSVCHECQFLQASVSLKRESFSNVCKEILLEHPIWGKESESSIVAISKF